MQKTMEKNIRATYQFSGIVIICVTIALIMVATLAFGALVRAHAKEVIRMEKAIKREQSKVDELMNFIKSHNAKPITNQHVHKISLSSCNEE